MKFIILVQILLIACSGKMNQDQKEDVTAPLSKPSSGQRASQSSFYDLSESIGIISFNNQGDYTHREEAVIYNLDGSIYAKFSMLDGTLVINDINYELHDLNSYNLKDKNIGFEPKEFYPETGAVIQFLCTNKQSEQYEIVVDKKTDLRKYIKVDSYAFLFQNWKDHVSNSYIDFDSSKNPLREEPLNTAVVLTIDSSKYALLVDAIEGDWIKLKCDEICIPCSQQITGWVRWKQNDKLLIKLSYIC